MKENKLVNIFKLNNSNQILITIIIKKKIFITEEETLKSIKPDNLAAWTLICAFFVLVFNFVLLETLVLKYKIFFYIIIISFILFFFLQTWYFFNYGSICMVKNRSFILHGYINEYWSCCIMHYICYD